MSTVECPNCHQRIPVSEYGEHIGMCRKIKCPECGEMVPTSTFIDHKEGHLKDLRVRMGIDEPKVPTAAQVILQQLDTINPLWRSEYGVSIPVIVDEYTLRLPIRLTNVKLNVDIHYDKGEDLYNITAYDVGKENVFNPPVVYHVDAVFWENLEEDIRQAVKTVEKPTEYEKSKTAELIVNKFDTLYQKEMKGPEEQTPVVEGVKIDMDTQAILIGEYGRAVSEPSIMPKGMTDPIDWALSNYLPILWGSDQSFGGYVDRKREFQTDEFPTGNYRRDYAVVKKLLKPDLSKDFTEKFDEKTGEVGYMYHPDESFSLTGRYREQAKEAGISPYLREKMGLGEKPTPTRKRTKLSEKQRAAINKRLGEISTGNRYYEKIPLNDIFKAVTDNDGVPLQEDWTEWSGMLLGEDGKAIIDIGIPETREIRDGLTFYKPYANTDLTITWHKMSSGRFEVGAYLS